METGPPTPISTVARESRVRVDLIGEGLLLAALVVSPWVYGAVQDSARYALCAILLVGAALTSWHDLSKNRPPEGIVVALGFPLFATAQLALRQTVAPIMTLEAAVVGFTMAAVWATIDSRAASSSTNSSRRAAACLLLVCLSESAFAAFQWSTDRTALFGRKGVLQTMPFGSYVNHNNFAGLVAMGVPLALAMALGDLRRSGKLTPRGLALLGLAVGMTIAVFASGSRGGAVALCAGLAVLVLLSQNMSKKTDRRSWRVGLGLITGLIVLAAVAVPASTRTRLVSLLERGGSLQYRIDILHASMLAFIDRPILGSGLGAFADAATPFKTGHGDVRSERAEADLVEFVVEGGIVLVALLLFLARGFWKGARAEMLEGRDRSGKWLRAGALSACSVMIFHSMFDFGFRIPANALAFAVLLGIATAGSAPPRMRSRFISRAWLLMLGIAATACVYRSIGAAGERSALARTNPESRLAVLQDLVDAHPYLDRARRQRGLDWMALAYSRGHYETTRLARAREDFEHVVAMRPQWGEAWADLGWVKYFQSHVEDAKSDMSKATRFDPTHVGVGIANAQLMAWSGDLPGALAEVSRLRRSNPQWSRASARELAASWTSEVSILDNIR